MVEYPYGVQYEWFALDAKGYAAVFNTAGIGPVPIEYLALPEVEEHTWRHLSDTCASSAVNGAKTVDPEFLQIGRKGIFVYDYPDIHRVRAQYTLQYELQVAPAKPLLADDLACSSPWLADLEAFPFSDRVFPCSRTLDPRLYFKCAEHEDYRVSTSRDEAAILE